MTADAFEESVREAKAAGMNDYISKPFSPEALWALLQRWLTPRA